VASAELPQTALTRGGDTGQPPGEAACTGHGVEHSQGSTENHRQTQGVHFTIKGKFQHVCIVISSGIKNKERWNNQKVLAFKNCFLEILLAVSKASIFSPKVKQGAHGGMTTDAGGIFKKQENYYF